MSIPESDLIIIGAGPAGLTAAIYAGRYRLNTLLLEKLSAGGQIILSPTIENYPGFPGGISTHELIERFKKQTEELDINVVSEEVTGLEEKGKSGFTVKTQDKSFETKSVIIASGAQSKRLGVPGEQKLIGRGVSYCGTCDGPFFKNKDIAVVGGGDRAIEEAIFLTCYAKTVYLIHRRDALRASKILEEKAKSNPKIKFILNSVIEEISGENKVESVKVKNLKTGSAEVLPLQGVFIFIGIDPNTGFIKDKLSLDQAGFIITDENMKTSKEGIFACGDCRKKGLYQVVNSCGEGASAAYSAHGYLLNL
ncbi:MAG: thioredoxin-disulfide reductase [Candidatus Omnitrophica bacterium]|nr:thioredoxin-disulfide reductase [Candidatus Omnitrophota bacterium]